jgi:hypothetical protein
MTFMEFKKFLWTPIPTKVHLVAIEFFVDSSFSILHFSNNSYALLSLSQACALS